jgi:hypothetical protein
MRQMLAYDSETIQRLRIQESISIFAAFEAAHVPQRWFPLNLLDDIPYDINTHMARSSASAVSRTEDASGATSRG